MVVRRGGAPDAASLDTLAVDLRHAIAQDEINLLFQPQVASAPGAIVGVEALVRWEHSAFGALGAETLFAAAERAELAIALSDH
ncbi:EAL domain-containing protein, partial [Acinetobacter baumannii]